MAEKITTEKILEERKFFKIDKNDKFVLTENYDKKESYRVYGVKTLQSYIQEIEDLRKNNLYKVEEHYHQNGEEINLQDLVNGNGLTAMLGLLTKEIKSAEISRYYEIATGGMIIRAIVKFDVELF